MVHCSFIFGHGGLHSNQFGRTCQNWFCPSWRCMWCMMAFAGAFTTKQQWMHIHTAMCTMTKLGWRQFSQNGMLCKNYCWAAIPDPIWMTNVSYERKINMLSSPDNNFMICLFFFFVERFSIEFRFPFFNSHCT